jgi:NADH-quinone oxidoreductase subunit M
MIYERTHTRAIDYYGGIAKVVPVFTVIFILVTLSSIGLPLTNGFVGELCCLLGAFLYNPWYGFWAGLGVILGAVYMLFLVKRVFFGRLVRESNKTLSDLDGRELVVILPLVIMIFVMGVMPAPFFERLKPAVTTLIKNTHVEPVKPAVVKPEVKKLVELDGSQPPLVSATTQDAGLKESHP